MDDQLEQSINQSIDQLVLRLQRREITSSRHAAQETAQLLYRFVGAAKFASIEQLIGMIKTVGSRLVAANPKQLAVGNIIRKVLRLIREEYKVACAGHLASLHLDDDDMDTTDDSSDDDGDIKLADGSIPGTPMPPTPGIHVPANHFLSDAYPRPAPGQLASGGGGGSFFPPGAASADHSPSHSPRPVPKSIHTASLSTFVQMRHNKIQLERAGSTTSVFANGTDGTGFDLTTMTPGIFASDLTSFFTPAINTAQERRTSFPGLTPHLHSASTPNSSDMTSTKHGGGRELRRAQNQAVKQQQQYEAFNKKSMQMKPVLVDAIREVVDEIETTWESCAKGAREHVHSS
ncbi:hypothetical protein QFC22_001570 [Naganishia vaughanmartiniae]|uniref:Uncharacterized protein n=1 Tax=Naganishia vaughanmartiniae TaxID=1424756 RepID=A0ACC2XK15_9TREE|nr:hypothetical protein QFC22_001570 [Naganishia vaughanmartiniae]